MSRPWLRDPRAHLAAILLAYAALAVSVQVRCADLLTSDGECYLRMAAYYAEGDFAHAVFGHWSPLGPWTTLPLVAAGMAPRVAFRLMIGLWGAAAVVGAWRLAGRLGVGPWLRAGAAASAALMAAEFSIDQRVDLLVAALLLFTLDAVLDERLLRSPRWALLVGCLGGLAYLSKQYALPFVAVQLTLVVLARAWAERGEAEGEPGRHWLRRAAAAWGLGLVGLVVVAEPWVAVLSAKYGRLTFGTAGSTSYAIYGPASGGIRYEGMLGLQRPPADAYNVWQDATLDATGPRADSPSPFASWPLLEQQMRFAGRNAVLILRHLAAADEFRLALASLALTPLAFVATWRRRRVAFRYLVVGLSVGLYCGGYAFVFAEDQRFYWFAFFVLTALAFHFAGVLPRALGARLRDRQRRLLAAAVGVAAVVSFAFHPVRSLAVLFEGPPPGRQFRLVAERLAAWGVKGPLASVGDRGWWDGLHTAYFLDAKYAGTPKAQDPRGIVDEMREAGATTLLVWEEPRLLGALMAEPGLELLATIPAGDLTGLTENLAVFQLRAASERPDLPSAPLRPRAFSP